MVCKTAYTGSIPVVASTPSTHEMSRRGFLVSVLHSIRLWCVRLTLTPVVRAPFASPPSSDVHAHGAVSLR